MAACITALLLAPLAGLDAADPPRPAPKRDAAPEGKGDKGPRRQNILVIGASSLNSPVPLTELVGAMLESKAIPVTIEGKYPELDAVSRLLGSKVEWDYVVVDAWHFGRKRGEFGSTAVPAGFADAVAAFVKQVRAHSPKSTIILFPWWIPGGPNATNEGAMDVFRQCAEQAKRNDIWVATTGPAYMEARLARPDLRMTKSKTDAHPGADGAYINACSLFAAITGQSPEGLPATLKITGAGGKKEDYAVLPDDAKYLQELAWTVYKREIERVKPARK
jgi:hypothetical protein